MVTCTTPPFRAAVRLNSGVRHHKAESQLRGVVTMGIVLFVAFSAFCFWAIFMRGVDVLDQYIISGRSSKRFGPRKLRLYIAVVWFLWLGLTLLQVFYGPKA